MNYSKAIFLVSDDVRAVVATYERDTPEKPAPRTVFKTLDKKIAVGDYVVVPTNTRHNMTVCRIVAVDVDVDFENGPDLEWIIGTVDRLDFEKIQQQEADAISVIKSAEKRRRREELRKSLLDDVGEDKVKALPIYSAKE